jgi:hypothetical protein
MMIKRGNRRNNARQTAVYGDNGSLYDLDQQERSETDVQDTGTGHEAVPTIGAKESGAVRLIRFLAVATIVLSTLGVALAVYYYMSTAETKTFKYRFQSDSYKILESIGSTFDRSLGSVDAFAVNIVSAAKLSNQTWPFVTASDYPVQSSKLLTLSKGTLISNYMFVTHSERPFWNNYTASHDAWVEESFDVQQEALNRTYFGPTDRNWTRPKDIWQSFGATAENKFYMPQWQLYPVIPTDLPIYNWDFWEYPVISAEKVLETHEAAISPVINLPDLSDPEAIAYTEEYAEFIRSYLAPGQDPYEPFSEIYYVRKSSMIPFWPSHCLIKPTNDLPLCGNSLFWKRQTGSKSTIRRTTSFSASSQ